MRRTFVFALSTVTPAVLLAATNFAATASASSRTVSLAAPTIAAPHSQDAPAVRAIGVLRSGNRRQSRAILQVNGGPPADYAEGDPLDRKWSVERIESDSVRISDGARHMQVSVQGGEAHPALRPAEVPQPQGGMLSAAHAPASASKQVLDDAARRRAIHLRRAD